MPHDDTFCFLLFIILLGCDGRPQPISGQSTTPMSSGVFSVRVEKGIDFFGIGIEDQVYLDQKAFPMNLLEQFGMKDCNPTMMPYVSGLNLK